LAATNTDNSTSISVTSGSEGFSSVGPTSLTAFNGPVYDYAFYDTNTDGAAPSTVGPQGIIGGLSDVSGTDSKVALWTTSDPATDAADLLNVGVRWQDNATFTIDISGLSGGSVYVFNGSWQARTDWLDISMTGGGQPNVDVTNFATSAAASNVLMNAKRIDFSDAADYGLLTFTIQESTEGNNGYFGGVVVTNVTAIPEPSSTALLGLGGLALILRRRK